MRTNTLFKRTLLQYSSSSVVCVKGRLHNYLDTSCSPLAIQVFNPSKAFKLFMIFFFFSKLDVVDIQATKRVRCHYESKT